MLELLQCLPSLCSPPDSQHHPGSILYHMPLLEHFHPIVFFFVFLPLFLRLLPSPALPFFLLSWK